MSERVFRFDRGTRIQRDQRTPQGGARIPAHVTRTGVFEYQNADGSIRRELRHPDDVFHPDAMKSLETATLTEGHAGNVTPDNWRAVSVGHVIGPRREGRFVAADVVVNDPAVLAKIDSGELDELSCGYDVTLVPESGVYNGEPYDFRQTALKYNHVAIGPRGWGRAGGEVRLRLDGARETEGDTMTTQYRTDDETTREDHGLGRYDDGSFVTFGDVRADFEERTPKLWCEHSTLRPADGAPSPLEMHLASVDRGDGARTEHVAVSRRVDRDDVPAEWAPRQRAIVARRVAPAPKDGAA